MRHPVLLTFLTLISLQGSNSRAIFQTNFMVSRSAAQVASSALASQMDEKRIVFIRHGCTYMNEFLGKPGSSYGSPSFTDIFPATTDYQNKYQDSKLSPLGVKQSMMLSMRLGDLAQNNPSACANVEIATNDFTFLQDLELVVVSPLTRALQTYQIGVSSHVSKDVPVVVVPLASERGWLISDIGRPRSQLIEEYPTYDFESAFFHNGELVEEWWFGLDDRKTIGRAISSGVTSLTYTEWRPSESNQKYAFPGEPDVQFDARMNKFYTFLRDRPEMTIAVVCHWGVIDWMLGVDFDNCELKVVPFRDIHPKCLAVVARLDQRQDGERC